jgi:hypothetical protein
VTWESPHLFRSGRMLRVVLAGLLLLELCATLALAQTIQPVIVEYTEKADGRFEVTNDTLSPMAIVLEPRSFSIQADGRGVFRALDAGIHVSLSTSSFRLEPKQTYYVFYKATADLLPAWFTIYAAFSPVHGGAGVTVRVMLPHTVYLYQKRPINREAIHVAHISYGPGSAPGTGTIVCDLQNNGPALVRVQEVRAFSGKTSVASAGFPLLPGSSRHLAIDWNEKARPEYLLLHFPKFDVKEPVSAHDP